MLKQCIKAWHQSNVVYMQSRSPLFKPAVIGFHFLKESRYGLNSNSQQIFSEQGHGVLNSHRWAIIFLSEISQMTLINMLHSPPNTIDRDIPLSG